METNFGFNTLDGLGQYGNQLNFPSTSTTSSNPLQHQQQQSLYSELPNDENHSPHSEPSDVKTLNNNMNARSNKKLDRIPENLSQNGTTPSGKPRLFVCTACTRAFARHEHLKRHERSHTKEKPFVCGVCQRRFSRRDLLLRHAQKLHASCPGAVKRIRRRSSRAKSDSMSTPDAEEGGSKKSKSQKEPHFNLFFTTNGDQSSNTLAQPRTPSSNAQFNNPNTGEFRGRRTSFSAISGPNYASIPESQHQRPYAGAVGFATPQLVPQSDSAVDNTDHGHAMQNWISDINSLPGLDFLSNFSLSGERHTQREAQVLGLDPSLTNSNNQSSTSLQSDDRKPPASRRSSKSTISRGQFRRRGSQKEPHTDIFGYSFYDDDYTSANQHDDFNNMKLSYPKLPSTYLNENTASSSPADGDSSTNNAGVNELELLSDLEVPNHEEQILSVGYSFYESNDFASSNMNSDYLRNAGFAKADSLMDVDMDTLLDSATSHLSSTDLFTQAQVEKTCAVLNRYPMGLAPPKLPSLEYLNYFVGHFKQKFLDHHPFIHKSLLNEKAMVEYTSGIQDDYAPNVCLPLLIATIGALYAQQRKAAADLYECSRRCIHVYLDSRKKTDETEKSTTHNSPLWLVQSLVLSVLYALFGEYDESDLNVILRQVNALCTLIRASKFNLIQFNHENIEINEQYFRDYILYQSKVRTVFMIFNISSTLTCFYNLDPFIKYKEIKCDLPDLESYWSCCTVDEFKQVCIKSSINYHLNLEKILNDMLFNNQINYKISEFGSTIMMYTVLQYFYFNKKSTLTNYSIGISPDHMNSTNLVKNYVWEDLLTDVNCGINMESIILKNITVIRSLMIDLSKVKEAMWAKRWDLVWSEFMRICPNNDDLIDACDYSLRTLAMMFVNDVDSSNFGKCLSLSCQALFFNFFYITKFLHRWERKVLKQLIPTKTLKPQDFEALPKNFSVYLKIAKFLADLEQLLTKNFGFHNPESRLALKAFDPSKITFGAPNLLSKEYPREVNLDSVVKLTSLKLSLGTLRIAEFVFGHIYEREMQFNIFKSLSQGMADLRGHVEKDLESGRSDSVTSSGSQ